MYIPDDWVLRTLLIAAAPRSLMAVLVEASGQGAWWECHECSEVRLGINLDLSVSMVVMVGPTGIDSCDGWASRYR